MIWEKDDLDNYSGPVMRMTFTGKVDLKKCQVSNSWLAIGECKHSLSTQS